MMKQSELSSLVGQRSPMTRMQNDTSVESKRDSIASAFQRMRSFVKSVHARKVTAISPSAITQIEYQLRNICYVNTSS